MARKVSEVAAAESCHKRWNLIISVFILVKILFNFHAKWIVARKVSEVTAARSCHKRGNLIINVFVLVKILLNFHE